MAAARNLPRDWRARDSAAPAADSIRQISWTTYFWPTARILLPAHDNAAPPLCDQPSPAHGRNGLNRVASLLGRSAMGQAGLWINTLQCEVNMPHAALVVAKTGAKTGAKTRAKARPKTLVKISWFHALPRRPRSRGRLSTSRARILKYCQSGESCDAWS